MVSDMRLIDADKLMEYVKGRKTRNYPKGELEWTIEQLPTIEAVPVVHGEWIRHETNQATIEELQEMGFGKSMIANTIYWTCSICGSWGTLHHKYCSQCGAKMKE
jgi:hypothetical protein